MSRFKAPVKPKVGSRPTTNLAGGEAFDRDPKVALASMVLTSMVQDTFYQKADSQIEVVANLAKILAEKKELLFAAKAALYTRNEFGMRSISHVLAGEIAQLRGEYADQRGTWGPNFFDRVVFRLDDMSEIASYWISKYAEGDKKTLPNAMKRGFKKVFNRAKPHLLAKWNGGSTRSMTLRQLAHLVHPRGAKGEGILLDSPIYQLRGGKLASADTHEVAISRAGNAGTKEQVEEAKADEWLRLFKENKIQYLAALRNARNIIEKAPDAVPFLVAKLTSGSDVRGSKVLPFQFLAAHDAVSELNGMIARTVLTAIEVGADLSLENVPRFEGSTLVVLDDSGSMHGVPGQPAMLGANQTSVVGGGDRHKRPAVIGAMFAGALMKANADCDVMLFSDTARYINFPRETSIFQVIEKLNSNMRPVGTDFSAPFKTANKKYDRIILLSDMQGWISSPVSEYSKYRTKYLANPMLYSWDLVGSTTSQFPSPKVAMLAAISDKVFDLMKLLERDPKALIAAIESVELG